MNEVKQKKRVLKKQTIRFLISFAVTVCLLFVCFAVPAYAAPEISIDLNSGEGANAFGALDYCF